ncbi:MAG: restriction endonuclease subunit S [Bacilli bacterium]|nr:restriction endonuclease subunit S [Bacilli bacterium]
MLLKEIFKSIYKGLRVESESDTDGKNYYVVYTKNVGNCIINYSKENIKCINTQVKDKYLLKEGDIIIASIPSNKTCHVGYCSSTEDNNVIINKNFIILRNPINNNYNLEFIAEYLENIGINNFFKNNRTTKEALTVPEVEDIEIPNISIEKQNELMSLINPINERIRLYNKLINNDTEIKEYLMNEVTHNEK